MLRPCKGCDCENRKTASDLRDLIKKEATDHNNGSTVVGKGKGEALVEMGNLGRDNY